MKLRIASTAFAAAALAGLLTISACSIRTEKGENGKDKKVDIATPIGGLKVRTDNVDVKDTGLPTYPNAKLKEDAKQDEGRANVNLDTPFFGLKVVAVTYTSDDSTDKVLGYYRDKLKGYGNVVECRGATKHKKDGSFHKEDLDKPVSCEGNPNYSVHETDDDKAIELKTGTNGNQRVVAVKPNGSGTEFSLVYVRVRGGKDDDSI